MTITNYLTAALIAVAPSALMAEDYTPGFDLSLGYAVNEDNNSETTITSRAYVPVVGGFGVQTDLDISENDGGVTTFGATLHAAYEINPDLAVGVFYGETNLENSYGFAHQGVEVTAGFNYFEVSAVAGLLDHEVQYYVLDASTGWFDNYTVGARFEEIETLDKTSSSLYVSRDLGNDFGFEVRVTDIEEVQDREIGFTFTKAIGGGAKFGDARALVTTMWVEPLVEALPE